MFILVTLALSFTSLSWALSVPFSPASINLSTSSSALPVSSHHAANVSYGQWPPTPLNIEISPYLEAVVGLYGDDSTDRLHIQAMVEGLEIIETAVSHGQLPTKDKPFYVRSGIVLFYLEIYTEPWPRIRADLSTLVSTLAAFTLRYRSATELFQSEIRRNAHGSRQPSPESLAEFILELDL